MNPDKTARIQPTTSTGLCPKRSLAMAEIGVAIAMNSTAKHRRPRKVSREKWSLPMPNDSENTVEM